MLHVHEIIWHNTALDMPSNWGINQPEVFVPSKTKEMVHRRSACNLKSYLILGFRRSLVCEISLILQQFKLTSLHTIFCLTCMSFHLRLHITKSSARPHVIPTEL